MMTYKILVPAVLALYVPACTPKVEPTVPPSQAPIAELWQSPDAIATRDLYYGPWGADRAPDRHATYTFVERKQNGTNPGITVLDPQGREWHVKQPSHTTQGAEGPTEVVLSRVLSAVGYHQPPVYYLPSFRMRDAKGTRLEPGGRFRLHVPSLIDRGPWTWQGSPFIGTVPYNGLRVLMLILNESDLKNSNNTLYSVTKSGQGATVPRRWYVVRDIGTALGETGRLDPKRDDNGKFERTRFITGVTNGAVDFDYDGRHQELAAHIPPADVRWMCDLLSRVSIAQWRDAFRAGGYDMAMGDRFIARIKGKIAEGQALAP